VCVCVYTYLRSTFHSPGTVVSGFVRGTYKYYKRDPVDTSLRPKSTIIINENKKKHSHTCVRKHELLNTVGTSKSFCLINDYFYYQGNPLDSSIWIIRVATIRRHRIDALLMCFYIQIYTIHTHTTMLLSVRDRLASRNYYQYRFSYCYTCKNITRDQTRDRRANFKKILSSERSVIVLTGKKKKLK